MFPFAFVVQIFTTKEVVMNLVREYVRSILSEMLRLKELSVDREYFRKIKSTRDLAGSSGTFAARGRKIADEWIKKTTEIGEKLDNNTKNKIINYCAVTYAKIYRSEGNSHEKATTTMLNKIDRYHDSLLRREVLGGFKSLNTTGSGGAQGNLRQLTATSAQKNRGIFDDIDDEDSKERQNALSRKEIDHTINRH